MNVPVRFSEAVETPMQDEEQVHRELIDTMRSITADAGMTKVWLAELVMPHS